MKKKQSVVKGINEGKFNIFLTPNWYKNNCEKITIYWLMITYV